MFLKAAINGGRHLTETPTVPLSPQEIAEAAANAVAAGADVVHAHARRADGSQTIHPDDIAAMVMAIRERDAGIIVGTTTGLWTCRDHAQRMQLVAAWPEGALPDFASVAFSEVGAAEAAQLVVDRGMILESAVWSRADVPALLASPTLQRNVRILIEPEDEDPEVAVAECRAIARLLRDAGVACSILYHGFDQTAWPVIAAAIEDGAETRVGFEDVLTLPDGAPASNEDMIATARKWAAAYTR